MLFINYSSSCNTVIPRHLVNKLSTTGISSPLCNWLLDFLINRPQTVRAGKNSIIMNTGVSQRCVLSPLLFTLMTHNCCARHKSNHIIKLQMTQQRWASSAMMTTQPADRRYINWCDIHNLQLLVNETKKITVDFGKKHMSHTHLLIISDNAVKSTKFLGVQITEALTWTTNTISLVKKAHQCLHFLRRMRRADLPPSALTTFYRGAIESILISSLVQQLLCYWPEGPMKGGEDSRYDHQITSAICSVFTPVLLVLEGHQYHQRPHPPSTWPVHPPTIQQALAHCVVQDYQTQQQLFSLRPSDSTHSRKLNEHDDLYTHKD